MVSAQRLALLGLAAAALLCSGQAPQPPGDERALEWAQEVVLRAAIGGERSATRRWTRPPTLSVHRGTAAQRKEVKEALNHLNETLAQTWVKKVALLGPNDPRADIQVYFAAQKKLPGLAKSLQIKGLQKEHLTSHWAFTNNKNELVRSYVLLASDKLSNETLRHSVLWGIVGTLGFGNRSTIYPDSIFSGTVGKAEELSERDRKLIVLFYNQLPPGSDSKDVARVFEKHWAKKGKR